MYGQIVDSWQHRLKLGSLSLVIKNDIYITYIGSQFSLLLYKLFVHNLDLQRYSVVAFPSLTVRICSRQSVRFYSRPTVFHYNYRYCVCCEETVCILIMSATSLSSYATLQATTRNKIYNKNGNRAAPYKDIVESNVREWKNKKNN